MTKRIPLFYAIVAHFVDKRTDDAAGTIAALEPRYGSYKLLTIRDVEEALATCAENDLLEECAWDVDEDGELRVSYRMTNFGHRMVNRYITPKNR